MTDATETTYQAAGVDTDRQELGLQRMIAQLRPTSGLGNKAGGQKLPIGFFANVLDIAGVGIAISTDGVGSKTLIAQMMGKYDTIGIDCVAMNVNDIICVGATPVSMVDYLALQDANPDFMEQIGRGLCEGAKQAGISISGGETAQLRDIIKGVREGFGFDLVGTAIGVVPLDRILVGQDIKDGDVIVGIRSNGVHSNGLSLARQVLFNRSNLAAQAYFSSLEGTLGDELLKPTHIYVMEALELLRGSLQVKALIHVTSDGFLNLTRVEPSVSFVIDAMPEIPSIFELIQHYGAVPDEEMFRVFNMGVGFCVIVPRENADAVISVVNAHGKTAQRIGYVKNDGKRQVTIESANLIGTGKTFVKR